jgi:hypothetical protein
MKDCQCQALAGTSLSTGEPREPWILCNFCEKQERECPSCRHGEAMHVSYDVYPPAPEGAKRECQVCGCTHITS